MHFPIVISHKSSYNNQSNIFYIKGCNEMCSPNNKFKFNYKKSEKYIKVLTYLAVMMIDQLEKRLYTNYSGENSLFGIVYELNYNSIEISNCNVYYN